MPKAVQPVLDSLDLAILEHYQADTQTPALRIGKAVGLSAAAVQRRLKAMRDSGVIARVPAQLEPTALGLTTTCIVSVQLASDTPAVLARFRKRAQATPEVQQCYFVTGSTDFVLIIVLRDMQAYEHFMQDSLLADADVRKFTTQVVMSRAKVGLDLCLKQARASE